MERVSRRNFLAVAAAAPAVLYAARGFAAAPAFRMGAQSYSFRNFKFPEPLDKLKELGLTNIEFCSAHFPPDPDNKNLPDIIAKIKDAGVKVVAYGVEEFTSDDDRNRKKFEFGKKLGLEILTANPKKDAFDSLDKLTKEYNIKIAIHNHGPLASYDKVADTLKAVEGRNPLIGACVDTGHVIRSGEKPHEVIKAHGARVHSLHLKDWVFKGPEKTLGEGDIDLVAVAKELKALNFAGPLDMEYEDHPDNPVPFMKQGLKNWNDAVAKVYA